MDLAQERPEVLTLTTNSDILPRLPSKRGNLGPWLRTRNVARGTYLIDPLVDCLGELQLQHLERKPVEPFPRLIPN